jgi:hypothetical protein
VLVEDRCLVCAKCNIGSKSLWMHPMVLQGDKAQVKACFCPLEIVLILTQDRCLVCAKCTLGSEIVLGALNGTPM